MHSENNNNHLAYDNHADCVFLTEEMTEKELSTQKANFCASELIVPQLTEQTFHPRHILLFDLLSQRHYRFGHLAEVKNSGNKLTLSDNMCSDFVKMCISGLLFNIGTHLSKYKPADCSQLNKVIHQAIKLKAQNIFSMSTQGYSFTHIFKYNSSLT